MRPSLALKLKRLSAPKIVLLLAVCAAQSRPLFAQGTPSSPPLVALVAPEPAALPDAPSVTLLDLSATPESSSSDSATDQQTQTTVPPDPNAPVQTKRILGIVPNFRSVSRDVRLPAQTPKEKFIIAGRDTFDYSSFFIAAIQAGFAMSSASYPEFHQGVKGYTRYYWHTLADTIDENFMVGGAGPALFHQDNRFYTLGHGSFLHRAGYAISRVAITRKDDGDSTFNFSEVIGSGAASGVSSLYYPSPYRTWTKVGQKWLTSMFIDGANFTIKEFWPDINKKAFHTHD